MRGRGATLAASTHGLEQLRSRRYATRLPIEPTRRWRNTMMRMLLTILLLTLLLLLVRVMELMELVHDAWLC